MTDQPTARLASIRKVATNRPDLLSVNDIRGLLAELDRRDADLAAARAEAEQLRAQVAAVTALLPADRAEDTNASWLPPREVRLALETTEPKETEK